MVVMVEQRANQLAVRKRFFLNLALCGYGWNCVFHGTPATRSIAAQHETARLVETTRRELLLTLAQQGSCDNRKITVESDHRDSRKLTPKNPANAVNPRHACHIPRGFRRAKVVTHSRALCLQHPHLELRHFRIQRGRL